MKVKIDDIEIKEGYICTYDDSFAHLTGVVRYGEWIQDGSGGEYEGTPCYGFYVEVTDISPFNWDNESSKEEAEKYYPYYLKQVSLVELLRSESIHNLEIKRDN